MLILPYKLPLKKCEGALLVRYNTCMKTIQWDKLWYNFPVLAQSQSGERAIFSKWSIFRNHYHNYVIAIYWLLVQNDCVGSYISRLIVLGRFVQPDGQKRKLVLCEVNF